MSVCSSMSTSDLDRFRIQILVELRWVKSNPANFRLTQISLFWVSSILIEPGQPEFESLPFVHKEQNWIDVVVLLLPPFFFTNQPAQPEFFCKSSGCAIRFCFSKIGLRLDKKSDWAGARSKGTAGKLMNCELGYFVPVRARRGFSPERCQDRRH